MSVVDPENANIMIENVLDNKLGYFMNIYKKRQFVTYEEYLLLKSFILDQYESVYILNNNVYMEQVPIYVQYSQETVNGLIVHFSESDDDEDEVPKKKSKSKKKKEPIAIAVITNLNQLF